jgi:hypothetical protein
LRDGAHDAINKLPRNAMRIKTVPIFLVLVIPSPVFAWGTGHDQVNELAVEMLRGVLPAESAANG